MAGDGFFRSFRGLEGYRLTQDTITHLQQSGYYYGTMTIKEAHKMLKNAPVGTYLIRDSSRPDYLFTLSYRAKDKPMSVRIKIENNLFCLDTEDVFFSNLFALLDYYKGTRLTEPLCKH